MAITRLKPEENATKLHQSGDLTGEAMLCRNLIRQVCVTEQELYGLMNLYTKMGRNQLKQRKRQQKENQRFRKAVAARGTERASLAR